MQLDFQDKDKSTVELLDVSYDTFKELHCVSAVASTSKTCGTQKSR